MEGAGGRERESVNEMQQRHGKACTYRYGNSFSCGSLGKNTGKTGRL